jgi:hypothetical protein
MGVAGMLELLKGNNRLQQTSAEAGYAISDDRRRVGRTVTGEVAAPVPGS